MAVLGKRNTWEGICMPGILITRDFRYLFFNLIAGRLNAYHDFKDLSALRQVNVDDDKTMTRLTTPS